jgi:hypothetical protein
LHLLDKAIEKCPNKYTDTEITENVDADYKRLESKHIVSSDSSSCPWTEMVIVLYQYAALAAIQCTRRSITPDLLVPKPSAPSGFFILEKKQRIRVKV